jgi:mono/diheme cytochrome c family protein
MKIMRTPSCRWLALASATLLSIAWPLSSFAQQKPFLGRGQSLTETIKRGEYLARIGDCVACHTKHGGKAFAGGFALPTPFGTL